MQTVIETREDILRLFDLARKEGQVKIERPDGEVFVLKPEKPASSSLDVPGVDLDVSTSEIVEIVREGRERR